MERNIIGIMGASGTGKTVLAKILWKSLSRAICFDTLEEYNHGALFDADRNGFVDYLEKNSGGRFRIIYRPSAGSILTREGGEAPLVLEDFDAITRAAYFVGSMWYVIEEADFFSSRGGSEPALDLVTNYGRKRALSMIWTARAPKAIYNELRNETQRRVLFALYEQVMLDSVAEWFGERAYVLPQLPKLTAYYWNPPNPIRLLRIAENRESFTLERVE